MDQIVEGGLQPPIGVVANFDNPPSLGTIAKICWSFCLILSTIVVGARMGTVWKGWVGRKAGWEDWTSLAAWVGLIITIILGFLSLQYGFGIHQWNVPLAHLAPCLKLQTANEVLYAPTLFLTKISILLQWIRIFVPHRKGRLYYGALIFIWNNFTFYAAYMGLSAWAFTKAYNPASRFTPDFDRGLERQLVATAAVNFVADIILLFLPLFSISRLQIPAKRKTAIAAVFGTGVIACVSSILRLYYCVKSLGSVDLTYVLAPVTLWSYIEITAGILCGCFPILPQFFRHVAANSTTTRRRPDSLRRINHSSPPTVIPGHGLYGHTVVPDSRYVELKEPDTRHQPRGSV